MNKDKRKIGIMGGTFDPPHLGHLISAQFTAEELGLDRVIFVPTGNISYKDNTETAQAYHRYQMVSLAISGNPLFDISDIESREKDFSYTCFTLEKLKKIHPDAHFYFIVGADSLNYMDKWKNPEKIFEQCTVVAVGRKGFTLCDLERKAEELKESFGADIIILSMPDIEISSTEIRNRIRENKSVKYLVPQAVEEYIKSKNLY